MGKNVKVKMTPNSRGSKSWGSKPWGSKSSGSKSWGASKKSEEKEHNIQKCAKADKRDITLLVLLLRHRIKPPVPHLDITKIVQTTFPESYQDMYRQNCKLENLTEQQQKYWFTWWCKEMEKIEIMKGGGRWVAAVNWENERIGNLLGLLRDQLQDWDSKFGLVDEEGVNVLKMKVGVQKEQKKKSMVENEILRKKELFVQAKEDESTLQADWKFKNDWKYGSVPDFTPPKTQSVIGQICTWPWGDFLRTIDDNVRSCNSPNHTASTISATSTYSSSTGLSTWTDSSTSCTIQLRYKEEDGKLSKELEVLLKRKKIEAMQNKLEKMNQAERDGRLNNWMVTDSPVEVC